MLLCYPHRAISSFPQIFIRRIFTPPLTLSPLIQKSKGPWETVRNPRDGMSVGQKIDERKKEGCPCAPCAPTGEPVNVEQGGVAAYGMFIHFIFMFIFQCSVAVRRYYLRIYFILKLLQSFRFAVFSSLSISVLIPSSPPAYQGVIRNVHSPSPVFSLTLHPLLYIILTL